MWPKRQKQSKRKENGCFNVTNGKSTKKKSKMVPHINLLYFLCILIASSSTDHWWIQTNIIHTKLRHYCILKYDLCKRNTLNCPQCSYGKQEDAYQFFFVCKNYSIARNTLFIRLLVHAWIGQYLYKCFVMWWRKSTFTDK